MAGNLTSITDPFGDSFSYTRNAQGQLKTVTGSPYAGWTSYITNVTYRAWGAAKGISYAGGGTSTIGFNWRLQQTSFQGGGMNETYSYYGDGRLQALTDLNDTPGNNPPVTLRFLSRSFNYDHVGRVTNGFGTGSGAQAVPFSQTYSYDAFGNMTGRSGSYYNYQSNSSLIKTDTSTYVNNRRTNWSYNLEGQVTSTPLTSTDSPRTMAYDAAGRMVSSVETGPFNTTTYTSAYDGDDQMVFESSTTSPGASDSSYIVRSSVLGEVLTRLDQSGNKKITYVPAEGLLFATQRASGGPGPYVLPTYRNPLGISETTKAVYDPLGNYIPFQAPGDPRPPAGSYSSASMSGLSSSQANAESYGVGCLVDNVPTTCKNVMDHLEKERGQKLQVIGPASTSFVARLLMTVTAGSEWVPVKKVIGGGERSDGKGFKIYTSALELWTYYIVAPAGSQDGSTQNTTATQQQNPTYSSGGQLSPCLRDALREFFPAMNVHGRSYSPVDDARFKSGIPSVLNIAQDNDAVTLGLYDIYFNPARVSLNGGYFDSLDTIVEEVAHTVQFLQTWAKQRQAIYIGIDLGSYDSAKGQWQADYAYYAIKGLYQNGDGYKNDVEKWAKNRKFDILSTLVNDKKFAQQGNVCGYDVTNYRLERPNW